MAMDDLWVWIALHEGREIAADSCLDQVFPNVVLRVLFRAALVVAVLPCGCPLLFEKNNSSNRGCNEFLKYISVFVRSIEKNTDAGAALFFEGTRLIFSRLRSSADSAELFILSVHLSNFQCKRAGGQLRVSCASSHGPRQSVLFER
ncbi:hypothetical protein LZK76_34795 (plasmid) [Rhizobium leguminosarum]|nr:hypothetical protein LZK76_34795 [Rhizobium leguminosarum]